MATDFDEMKPHSLKISKPFAPMFTGILCACLKCLKTSYETRKPLSVSKSHIPLGYETRDNGLILTQAQRLALAAAAIAQRFFR